MTSATQNCLRKSAQESQRKRRDKQVSAGGQPLTPFGKPCLPGAVQSRKCTTPMPSSPLTRFSTMLPVSCWRRLDLSKISRLYSAFSDRAGPVGRNSVLLKRPDLASDETNLLDRYKWLDPNCVPPPMPFDDGSLRDLLLDPAGVSFPNDGRPATLSICKTCYSDLKKKRMPALSLANRTFLGPVPPELENLTVIEEAMIARCRSKCWIIQLKEENQDLVLQSTQRGIKGHIIVYPQQPSKLADVLPPSIEEITTPVCVLFVGSSTPTPEWLREHAKPLCSCECHKSSPCSAMVKVTQSTVPRHHHQ